MDTDELDENAVEQLETTGAGAPEREQRMPLLVGLMDSAAARRSLDTSLSMTEVDGERQTCDVDLEELASKRTAGGSMIDSVANMANSILGAGGSSESSR